MVALIASKLAVVPICAPKTVRSFERKPSIDAFLVKALVASAARMLLEFVSGTNSPFELCELVRSNVSIHRQLLMQIKKGAQMDAIGEYQKAKSTDLDMFFSEQNIARYRKLSNPETDEGQRRTILRLLKKEFVKLRGSASR